MTLDWTWWGFPGTLLLLAAWSAAIVVLRTAPTRAINQRLALVLFAAGGYVGLGTGILFFFGDVRVVRALGIASIALHAALPFLYLAFLGASLDTRLVRPFRSRRAFALLALVGAAAATLVVSMHDRFVTAPYHPGWAPWNFQLAAGGVYISDVDSIASVFALVAAIAAYRGTARGSAARQRAKWFIIAFGVRDAYAAISLPLYPIIRPIAFWGDFVYNPGQAIVYLLFVLALAYGVLSTQMLDIQIRLRIAIEQSTVGAAIAGAFLVVSELIESFTPVSGWVESLIVAVLIVVALRPVQRVADRFAGRIMRGASASPEWLGSRRLEVYRAAVEGAMEDGVLTDREAAILARLREQLELSDEEVNEAEARLLSRV